MIESKYQKNSTIRNNTFSAVHNISDVDFMEGHTFEFFCAYILDKNGFENVSVTKGSGDQGVDVLASKNGIRYAVQCKNYATPLSNTPIQEVYAGKTHYNCHVGVVMTNSSFTPGAIALAESTGVLIWDRKELQRMIEIANQTQPIRVKVRKKKNEVQNVTIFQCEQSKSEESTYTEEQSNNSEKGFLRKSMKNWAIVCFALALIYIWMGIIIEPFAVAGSAVSFILGIMFLVLALTPKESSCLFGRENGIQKKSFVWVCVALAVFSFGVIANLLQ